MLDIRAIQDAKLSSSFSQEYELSYQTSGGTLFDTSIVDAACKEPYSLDPQAYVNCGHKSLGLDPGQHMACVVLCYDYNSQKIRVLYSKQWERPDYKSVFDEIWQDAIVKFNVKRSYIDGSQPPVVAEFMFRYNDDCKPNYQDRIKYYESKHIDWTQLYHCQPVNFGEGQEGRTMLSNLKILTDSGKLQIHPSFTDLRIAFQTAVTRLNFDLDKNSSVSINNHALDACRLAAKEFRKI